MDKPQLVQVDPVEEKKEEIKKGFFKNFRMRFGAKKRNQSQANAGAASAVVGQANGRATYLNGNSTN